METGWGEKGAWAIAWQQKKSGIYVELLNPLSANHAIRMLDLPPAQSCVFGLSSTAESALEKVEMRLKGDPFFKKRWAGGAFRPIPYHLGIVNDDKLLILPGDTEL